MKSRLLRLALVVVAALILGYAFRGAIIRAFMGSPEPLDMARGLERVQAGDLMDVVATDLEVPWELAFLPGGDLLVTERPGNLTRLARDDDGYRVDARIPVDGVRSRGEAGLMGMALHPRFAETRWIYLCFTTDVTNPVSNRVMRYRLAGDRLADATEILTDMPAAGFHDGCRIAFGPDGFLYVTMGDAGESSNAQDLGSLSGKIHRVAGDGSVPPDNPYGTTVWTWGHRNPQGLAWDDEGRLWETEHGPSGLESGLDELNLIEKGANYGWPLIRGDERRDAMRTPVAFAPPEGVWAPAGLAFLDGSLFFGGLRGEALYQARIVEDGSGEGSPSVELTAHFWRALGRIRAVTVGPDGDLWLTTSNRDGRGRVRSGDDRIVRVAAEAFR